MNQRNNQGVLGLPIYFLIAFIVTAVILAIFIFSAQILLQDAQIRELQTKTGVIVNEAENMFEHADEGTLISLHIEFPSSLRFLVFGSLPKNSTDIPTNLTLNENTSNNYYFVMQDGRISTGHSNARFSNREMNNAVLFYPGVYDLTLELKRHDGRTYVTMYEQ